MRSGPSQFLWSFPGQLHAVPRESQIGCSQEKNIRDGETGGELNVLSLLGKMEMNSFAWSLAKISRIPFGYQCHRDLQTLTA